MNRHRADTPESGNYDDSHRAFLQAFLSDPVKPVEDVVPLIAKILTAHEPDRQRLVNDITQPIINSMVQAVNAKIAALDFEIRSTRNQENRTLTYALVNTTSDTFTQLATSFSPDEIAYIKRLLDAMFEINNTKAREIMAVKGMDATNLAKAPRNRQSQAVDADEQAAEVDVNVKSIKHEEADKVLQQLVTQGFFQKSRRGWYSLAPRALMELRTYLKETYNEPPADDEDDPPPIIRIRDCEGCREIVTVGLRCGNRECGIRWHDGCGNQYFRGQQGGTRKCPACDTEWTGDVFVGERADRVNSRASTNGRSSMRTRGEEEDN
ncbi:hypothetical protein K458DRAFT_476057 [Lentithecium fluviatile CBS 122367]|uniref:Non-structural maintenance of chromosomes element 1 homolog n=1 Tax=Lentithecium fluviatile CBS 122367 TaxID=1168545 RepID=A0A6G1J9N3_9PLEO|nr:hypothetical protein K458DRAFT_476057 [Lentithecium fluviatile CBS 122367]